jgi:transforming growth factor-beta-induced protein
MIKQFISKFVASFLIVVFAFAGFVPAAQAAGQAQPAVKVAFSATADKDDDDDDTKNIVEVVLAANAENGEFSILIAALQAADPSVIERLMSKKLRSTVFAPTDAAFGSLLEELGLTAEELLSDQALVTDVLKYHIARGKRDSEKVINSRRIPTLLSQYLYQDQGVLTDANGRTANIVTVDIKASNGIIHVIDRVVLPIDKTIVEVVLAENAESGEFSILIAALQAADPTVINRLMNTRRQSTVFAPTDAAFEALLEELGLTAEELLSNQALLTDVLKYHVARGNRDSVEVLDSRRIPTLLGQYLYQDQGVLTDANGRTANIVAVDIKASNGIIHVIDRVVLPVDKTIVDVVLETNAESGEFSILIAALQAADPAVINRLMNSGRQSTVFAPTDAAFEAALEEFGLTAEQLLSNQALLTQVLLYHVAPGNRDSVEVLDSTRIRTLQGQYLYQDQGVLTDANDRTANIVEVDIMASNGVIHVIDNVVLPDPSPRPDDDDGDDD